VVSAREQWSQLSPRQQGAVVAVTTVDVGLRVLALADLARRPADGVRGPKWAWAVGLSVVNSVGVLPAVYLRWGRHPER
jgi:hypothetical protein